MKAKPKVIVETGTAEEFFARGRDRAKKLDKGERLKREIRVTFEDPEALAQVLTGERIRLLKACRQKPRPMVKLAFTLRRDRTAVRRDVRILESFGLLRTREESNPGHGRVKIVEPLAEKVLVSASI